MLQNPELIGEIVKAVSQSTSKPVTVKMRKGFEGEEPTCIKAAVKAAENGAAAVTIHGRTREQYYSGKADWDIIKDCLLYTSYFHRPVVDVPVFDQNFPLYHLNRWFEIRCSEVFREDFLSNYFQVARP